MNNKLLFLLSVLVIIFSISMTHIQLQRIDSIMTTGNSVHAGVSLCLNRPPELISHNCSGPLSVTHTGHLREPYECTINGSDPEGTQITYSTNSSASIDPLTGVFSLEEIKGNSSVSIPVMISDQSECLNNKTEVMINFSLNKSGGVLFTRNYPNEEKSSITLTEGFTSFHNDLDDHFEDIDGYPLSYSVERLAISCYNLDISINESTHQVVYSVPYGAAEDLPCQIRFHARNPYGDHNQSNIVTINIEISEEGSEQSEEEGSGGSTGDTSGSSASGGMPLGSSDECVFLEMNCTEWSNCTYQDPDLLPLKPTHFVSWNLTNDGVMKRSCTWTTNCPDQMAPRQKKQCDYKPTCNDGMKNCHEPSMICEEGIDCGGPCAPCATCNDWKQNCVIVDGERICEEGIDCGGVCEPCSTCDDGIKNCIRLPNKTLLCEDKIDCGGPCNPCSTCDDGIRNCHMLENGSISCEEGIDCGGPCPKCMAIEGPTGMDKDTLLNIMLIAMVLFAGGFLIYRLRKPIYNLIIERYITYIQRSIKEGQQLSSQQYLAFYDKQLKQLSYDFDSVTSKGTKEEGDRLLIEGSTSGYNIDRYSVSFDNDYADILTDNSVRTINYAFYASDMEHGKRILQEMLKADIKPNYSICKRSSTVEWAENWKRDRHATYERVNGRLMARTVEYILSFRPKDEDETNKIVKILERYGKGKQGEGWDIPDIRITGQDKVRDFEKQILNVKTVDGQKLMVLTKDKALEGYESSSVWINSALSKVIK
ncbi:MAG: hypothetical protein R6V53_01430 [Candidatus Woesearchaeota archaeon]